MIKQTESQKVRLEMRDAIEKIVKEKKINREKCHEVSKCDYQKVINKTYYAFCDYQKYPTIQLSYLWTRLRASLRKSEMFHTNWDNWQEYVDKIDNLISDKNPNLQFYLIVDGGWIYEGELREIKEVLYEYPGFMEDFYLVSRDYEWLIIHCDDGACMFKVYK